MLTSKASPRHLAPAAHALRPLACESVLSLDRVCVSDLCQLGPYHRRPRPTTQHESQTAPRSRPDLSLTTPDQRRTELSRRRSMVRVPPLPSLFKLSALLNGSITPRPSPVSWSESEGSTGVTLPRLTSAHAYESVIELCRRARPVEPPGVRSCGKAWQVATAVARSRRPHAGCRERSGLPAED